MFRVTNSNIINVQKQLPCFHGVFLSNFWAEYVKTIICMNMLSLQVLETKYPFQYSFAFAKQNSHQQS
jgi:hypothetical protein